MEKYISLLLLFIVPAFAIQGPDIRVSLSKYDPFPAEPGKYVTVWLKVENDGGDVADNVVVELMPEYPFSLVPNEEGYKKVGLLKGLEYELVKYKLIVDSNAISGDNDLKVRYKACDICMWVTEELTVNVAKSTNMPELELLLSSVNPEAYPGGTSEINVDIVNTAPGTAYYVLVEMSSPVASIEPEKIYVGNLEADDIDTLDFVATFQNVEPGTYPINFKLRYKDSDFDVFEKNETINIFISKKRITTGEDSTILYIGLVLSLILILYAKKKGWIKLGNTFKKIMAA